jgi:glycosyltransferase involved in cell wall biosynthesis
MPQYRIDFFNLLKDNLNSKGIELIVIYGKSADLTRNDELDIPWAIYRKNKVINFFGKPVYWQPVLNLINKNDLVIVEQANALLVNYCLLYLRSIGKIKFAYWGHGKNRQGNAKSVLNVFKQFLINKCDHWFAYTKSVKEYLIENKVNEEVITVLNNSIDTVKLRAQYLKIPETDAIALRSKLEINENDPVLIYCGALYKEKKLDFLLDALIIIHTKIPEVKMIFMGAGPEKDLITNFCSENNWSHYVGVKFDLDKIPYFKISNAFLMPGAVGLAALDALSMMTPMILCDIETHGPEIDYLTNGHNAIITNNTIEDYSKAVVDYLKNKEIQKKLIANCHTSIASISLESMVTNFSIGIEKILKS